MKIRSAIAAASAVLIGTALVTAPSADAAAPSFAGAGYLLTGPHQVTLTFVMPSVTCGSSDGKAVNVGAFGPSGKWHVTASVACYHGRAERDLEIDRGNGGQGEGGTGLAKPGHIIEITLSGLDTAAPAVSIRDTNAPGTTMTDHLTGPTDVGAGAFGDPVANFSPPITMHASVNSGQRFTSVPHPRHNLDRGTTTLIKTGSPSPTGTHFALYFRHH